jgi:hypothetical protein
MERLRIGDHLERNDAIYVLRERLQKEARERGKTSSGQLTAALVILAWNHYRNRTSISKIQLPSVLSNSTYPRPI